MLTVARAPLRVSLFGGGSDYPEYFQRSTGAVLGMAIDKYVYITALPMIGYAESRYRVTYRTVESVNSVDEIKHPSIRAVLKELSYDEPLNIATLSDLPGNSGLGSSSSFTAAFIKLIEHLKGRDITRYDLMRTAVRIERDILRENVGIQDQTHAAFGGFSLYTFFEDRFDISPVQMTTESRDALNATLCLVFTGRTRVASTTLDEQVENTRTRKIDADLSHLVDLCHAGANILKIRNPEQMLRELGSLISEGWRIKRALSSKVSNTLVDDIYEAGMKAGAYGGKLCGAGDGGFFMFLASPAAQQSLIETFGASNFVKIRPAEGGAEILKG